MKRSTKIVGALAAMCMAGVAALGGAYLWRELNSKADRKALVPDLPADATNVLYLHHSTGENIWNGGIEPWVNQHNQQAGTKYHIVERAFPNRPYPWLNDPHDYYRLWVEHGGDKPYRGQATLEQLVPAYDVIVWKQCFVGSDIVADEPVANPGSETKTVANYKLQYEGLKQKMLQFPDTKFIVWTLPPNVEGATNADSARRSAEFTEWVKITWDEPGDNIFVWDFREIAADDKGLYLRPEYAMSATDSHPNQVLATKAAPMFGQRLVDVIEGRGDSAVRTGGGQQ